MANPNPPTPPSIYDVGLRNHLGDKVYDEFVKLYNSRTSDAAISRYLFENKVTETLIDRKTIGRWRKVHEHELLRGKS